MANRVAGLLSQMFRYGIHRQIVETSPVQLLQDHNLRLCRNHPKDVISVGNLLLRAHLMAYRIADRKQHQLLPSAVEDYVGPDDPVRAYDAFVECLNPGDLGLAFDPDQVGRPQYDPVAMLKLLVYGYAYGIRSSRKLERATHHNLSFVWLMGGLKPDHKTIARFRRDHCAALALVLRQCAQLCLRMGLIEGNTLFVDGTKIRANASNSQTWTVKRCQEELGRIDDRVAQILRDCEHVDGAEDEEAKSDRLPSQLHDDQALRQRVQSVLAELQQSERSGLNTTDPEAGRMRIGSQVEPGYNCQIVVDERHGLVVHADAGDAGNDVGQMGPQILAAQQTLGKNCREACADAGYCSPPDLATLMDQGIDVVVPIVRHSDFRDHFSFDAEQNVYICPEGKRLEYMGDHRGDRYHIYGVRKAEVCLSCPRFGSCTRSRNGRRLARPFTEVLRTQLEKRYERPIAKALMRRRKQRAEHPFGHLKHNLGLRAFLLRGRGGVRAEMSLCVTAFNLRRMMTVMGTQNLVNALAVA
jgi:transposase